MMPHSTTRLSQAELKGFATAVDGVLSRLWPEARALGEKDFADRATRSLWDAAVSHGWTGLAGARAIDAVIVATERLGRVACPLPLMDIYIAGRLFAEHPALVAAIESGEIRPIVASSRDRDTRRVRWVEAGQAATHVVVLDDTGTADLREIESVTATAGLARPPWSDVELSATAVASVTLETHAMDDAKALLRLGLIARAVAAAQRTVEYSLTYANERVAFGRPIGSFQAVSHRVVNGCTAVTAAQNLIEESVTAYLAVSGNRLLTAELAVEFGSRAAVDAQFGAHYTLAASGYFEEHDAPWLFRRVNADVARLAQFELESGTVADLLIERKTRMPSFDLGDEAERFREEVVDFLRPFTSGATISGFGADAATAYVEAAAARGYLTMSWPVEDGGAAASVEKHMVLAEELAYHRLPLMAKSAADLLGTAIIRHGTAEQKARMLPMIAAGDLSFYLGYSEPEIGSDLANLHTRAVRDGAEWIVNGRKMWGTGADHADWVWLAARTDPAAVPPHSGITVFLTRTDRPGWEYQPHIALSGEISCSTFFDDYRIPDADRIGEVNGGWKVISEALAQERVLMANSAAVLLRLFDDMVDEVHRDPGGTAGIRGSDRRGEISRLAARLQAARSLVNASVRATATVGGGARLEAPMAKILATQLMADFGDAALRIFGPSATLSEGVRDVPGSGAFEYNLRLSIMQVVGGGTIDIQHNLVARALGLPR